MRILIGCEFSGIVRRAFRAKGHQVWSCDLLPSEDDSEFHLQCDVLTILNKDWDLAIFHPPCTHLAVSGARWFKDKQQEQTEAIEFFMALINAPIDRIAVENPVSIMSTRYRKPDQYIQPYQFGHMETKKTGLWLKVLPCLSPTSDLKTETMALPENERMRLHYLPPSPDRGKLRSVTFQGIADAMADQWGGLA